MYVFMHLISSKYITMVVTRNIETKLIHHPKIVIHDKILHMITLNQTVPLSLSLRNCHSGYRQTGFPQLSKSTTAAAFFMTFSRFEALRCYLPPESSF